jgi:hypothetical protein
MEGRVRNRNLARPFPVPWPLVWWPRVTLTPEQALFVGVVKVADILTRKWK